MPRPRHTSAPGPLSAVAAAIGRRGPPLLLPATLALLVARPLFPSESAAREGDGLAVAFLALLLVAAWAIFGLVARPFRVRAGWIDLAVGVLLAWHSLAACLAAQIGSPRPALNMLWEWLGLGACYWLVRQSLGSGAVARALLLLMVGVATLASTHGLYQAAVEMPATRRQYEADPEEALAAAGLALPPGSPERQRFEARLYSREPLAAFALTNSLAGLLVPWLLVAAGGLTVARAPLSTRRVRIGLGLAAVVVGVCLALTRSRSGYVAAGVGLAVLWAVARGAAGRQWLKPLVAAAGVGAALVVVAAAVQPALLRPAATSLGYRWEYWRASVAMIGDAVLFGVGPGHFQQAYTRYKLPAASEEVADPHNFLVEVAATAGVPAAAALIVVLLLAVRSLRLPVERDPSAPRGGHGRGERAPPQPPGPRGLAVAALLGFVIALPLGAASAAPPGIEGLLVGLAAAAAAVALAWPWTSGEGAVRPLAAVALAALVVHLSASGGIGLPGVAGSFWLLLAVTATANEDRGHRLGPAAAFVIALVAVALAIAAWVTGYGPVGRATRHLRAAADAAAIEEHLQSAAAADPLWSEPLEQLAAVEYRKWLADPADARAWRQFQWYLNAALELDPREGGLWYSAGNYYWNAHRRRPDTERLKAAVAAFERAVDLYPNSPDVRGRLAVALAAAGRTAEARQQADRALRLDAVTPHEDKKLPAAARAELQAIVGPSGG